MDSLSQIALGAAVSIAVFRRRQPLWQSAVLGALAGTLPDLDVLVQFDDPISEMTRHRAESHGLFYLTLASWPLAWLWLVISKSQAGFRRCWWAIFAVLISHALLDTLTIYGTQLAQPFSDRPFGTGSVFVIDPLYTIPLLLGLALTLKRQTLHNNDRMLGLSTLYLGFGLLAQQHVKNHVMSQLPAGISSDSVLVTATPFNTLVWQVLVLEPHQYREGFYALADSGKSIVWRSWPRDQVLLQHWQQQPSIARLTRFSHTFVVLTETPQALLLADLRMGLAPHYSFHFAFRRHADGSLQPPCQLSSSTQPGQISAALHWLYLRASRQQAAAFFNPQVNTATALQQMAQQQCKSEDS
jgi:inner membrane protein